MGLWDSFSPGNRATKNVNLMQDLSAIDPQKLDEYYNNGTPETQQALVQMGYKPSAPLNAAPQSPAAPQSFQQFKQRFAQSPQGQAILKSAQSPAQAMAAFQAAWGHYSANAVKQSGPMPSKTGLSFVDNQGVAAKNPVTQVMKTSPSGTDAQQTPVPAPGKSVLNQTLSKFDTQGNKDMLKDFGFTNPGKSKDIIDAIISGLSGIGAAASHNPEAASNIQQGLMGRMANREGDRNSFKSALLGLAAKDTRPNIVKEFESYSAMPPDQQAKMAEYLKLKTSTNPLLAAIAGKL